LLRHKEALVEGFYEEVKQIRSQRYCKEQIIAESNDMKELINIASQVAKVDSTILLTGELGVGKGVIARYIHKKSSREKNPFITLNCGAIPKDLFESELFGYEGGAFTGANPKGKKGYFELADGGTLFLDEIGELPQNLQVKLLSVLQDHEIKRVGSEKTKKVNIRVIAATNQNLDKMV